MKTRPVDLNTLRLFLITISISDRLYSATSPSGSDFRIMALIDKIPGDFNLYIGGYVISTVVSRYPMAAIWGHSTKKLSNQCYVVCLPCDGVKPSSKPI